MFLLKHNSLRINPKNVVRKKTNHYTAFYKSNYALEFVLIHHLRRKSFRKTEKEHQIKSIPKTESTQDDEYGK